jgi:hypothetical protein
VGEGGRVTTLDLDEDIVAGARVHLAAAGVTGVRVVCADGWAGCVEAAPFAPSAPSGWTRRVSKSRTKWSRSSGKTARK